jgi:coatomer subunit beta'
LLASIPESQYTTIARFLESQGFKEEALAVSTDPDHKFDLSLELGHIDIAHSLMGETPEEEKETTETMTKWKRLSDAALKDSNFELCESASFACNDFSGLLLLYSALGNLDGMESLAKAAEAHGKVNIAFTAYLLTGNIESCLNILISSNRFPEAAFFARTYMPSRVNEMVALWKTDLAKISETASKALASPSNHASLFPDFEIALQVETMFIAQRESAKLSGFPSVEYVTAKDDLDLDLISLIKSRSGNDESSAVVIDDEANVGNTVDYTSPHESVPQQEEDEMLQQDKTMIVEQERLAVTDDIMLEDEAPDEEFMEANIEEDKTLDAPVTKEDNDFADDWE